MGQIFQIGVSDINTFSIHASFIHRQVKTSLFWGSPSTELYSFLFSSHITMRKPASCLFSLETQKDPLPLLSMIFTLIPPIYTLLPVLFTITQSTLSSYQAAFQIPEDLSPMISKHTSVFLDYLAGTSFFKYWTTLSLSLPANLACISNAVSRHFVK